ncbi:MAG: flagellar basal body rod protein FlgB [Clostridium sp.]|nr:flagellar basal body rod protein FlgB [Clostridium sp.]
MKINNMSESERTYELLKKSLDAAEDRKKVIANNLANINTKEYKRLYVTFEETLKESKDKLKLETTDKRHISNESEYGQIEVKRDDSTSMRKDGNNVDDVTETVNLAANTLKYNALITELNSRMSTKRYVISGGR